MDDGGRQCISSWMRGFIQDGGNIDKLIDISEDDLFFKAKIKYDRWPPDSKQIWDKLLHDIQREGRQDKFWNNTRRNLETNGRYTTELADDSETIHDIVSTVDPYYKIKSGLVVSSPGSNDTDIISATISKLADSGYNIFIVLTENQSKCLRHMTEALYDDLQSSDGPVWKFQSTSSTYMDPLKGLQLNPLTEVRHVILSLTEKQNLMRLMRWLDDGSSRYNEMKVTVIDRRVEEYLSATIYEKGVKPEYDQLSWDIAHLGFCSSAYIMVSSSPLYAFRNTDLRGNWIRFYHECLPCKGYVNSKNLFLKEEHPCTDVIIQDIDEDMQGIISKQSADLPKSLIDSICWFICETTLRHDDQKIPIMVIPIDRIHSVQIRLESTIRNFLEKSPQTIIDLCMECVGKTGFNIKFSDDIDAILNDKLVTNGLDAVDVCVNVRMNDDFQHPEYNKPTIVLNYRSHMPDDDSLELICTYLYRNISDGDSALHMYPWFGKDFHYRHRIVMSPTTYDYFKDLTEEESYVSGRLETTVDNESRLANDPKILEFIRGKHIHAAREYVISRSDRICDDCGRIIPAGETAFVRNGPSPAVRCLTCGKIASMRWVEHKYSVVEEYENTLTYILRNGPISETEIDRMCARRNRKSLMKYIKKKGYILEMSESSYWISYVPQTERFLNELFNATDGSDLESMFDKYGMEWYWIYKHCIETAGDTTELIEYTDSYDCFTECCIQLLFTNGIHDLTNEENHFRNIMYDESISEELLAHNRYNVYRDLMTMILNGLDSVSVDESGLLTVGYREMDFDIIESDEKMYIGEPDRMTFNITSEDIYCTDGTNYWKFIDYFDVTDETTKRRLEYLSYLKRSGF